MFTSTASLIVVATLFALLGIGSFIGYRMVSRGSRLMVTAALKRFASDFGLNFWTHSSPYHDELANLTGRSRDAISNVLLRKLGDAELVWFEVLVSGGKTRTSRGNPKGRQSLSEVCAGETTPHRLRFTLDGIAARTVGGSGF